MDAPEDVQQSVEYVSEQLDVKGAAFEAFSDVFARFQLPPDEHAVRFHLCSSRITHIDNFARNPKD